MSENKFKFISKHYQLSLRLEYIIFPFNAGELMSAIAKNNLGYILAPPPPGNALMGTNFDMAGIIAKKGNTLVNFDSLTQLIGVEGNNPTECTHVFSEILDIICAWLDPQLEDKSTFYELIANHTVETGKNPLEAIRNQKFKNDIESTFSKIMGEDFSNFSIYLSSPLNKIGEPSWHDIKIQPLARRPDKEYAVMTVYRKPELKKTIKFTNSLEDNFKDIFKTLELS